MRGIIFGRRSTHDPLKDVLTAEQNNVAAKMQMVSGGELRDDHKELSEFAGSQLTGNKLGFSYAVGAWNIGG